MLRSCTRDVNTKKEQPIQNTLPYITSHDTRVLKLESRFILNGFLKLESRVSVAFLTAVHSTDVAKQPSHRCSTRCKDWI